MSSVLSLRLPDPQAVRLKKYARRLGRTPSETGRILLDEALRQIEFPLIEFRESSRGRQAYVKGHRTAVWMVTMLAKHHGNSVQKTAKYLQWPEALVEASLDYRMAFPDEIDLALEENRSFSFEKFKLALAEARMSQERS